MSAAPSFEEYLVSKKIDSSLFRNSEPEMWSAWKKEFDQMHPNSFTVQKLNLINPIRRKYQLAASNEQKSTAETVSPTVTPSPVVKPGRPVIRPKRD
jgi:hypothetical protein